MHFSCYIIQHVYLYHSGCTFQTNIRIIEPECAVDRIALVSRLDLPITDNRALAENVVQPQIRSALSVGKIVLRHDGIKLVSNVAFKIQLIGRPMLTHLANA